MGSKERRHQDLIRRSLTRTLQLRARRHLAHRKGDCFIGRSLEHKWNVHAAPVSCKR
jgi:hypothetical protein